MVPLGTNRSMDDTQLEAQVGDTLQLQFVGDETARRYHTRLVGYLADKSLLITTPRKDGRVILMREGQAVVVRMLSGNTVCAFSTSVLLTCMRPYPYLHLAYPKELEKIVVRKAHRARTHLLVTVQPKTNDGDTGSSQSAVVVDISTTGALLHSPEPLGRVGDVIMLGARLNVGEVGEYLQIPAVIRNIQRIGGDERAPEYSCGVEFQMVEAHDAIVLHGYVYEHLINT